MVSSHLKPKSIQIKMKKLDGEVFGGSHVFEPCAETIGQDNYETSW